MKAINQVNWNWIFNYNNDGKTFLDLNKVSDTFYLTQYSRSALDQCTVGGELAAVPVSMTGRIFYWNKTTFEKAGISTPTTLEELMAAGETFKTVLGDEYYPLAAGEYDRMILMVYYLESVYGKAWVVDGKLNYTTEEIQKGLEFINELEDKHVIPTIATILGDGAESLDKNPKWMENGHGAVTLGSEMSAGIKNVLAEECLFRNTDRGLRIKTRRGRGQMAVAEGISFKDIVMDGVKTPFVANCFYFCDPDGRTGYVQDRKPLPVDERTPYIGRLCFENIKCINCHYAAAYFIGLPEKKIGEIILKNVSVSYADNAEKGHPAMLCGIEEMSRRGIVAENVEKITLENVDVKGQTGEPVELHNVDELLNGEK